jgi:hypothetical protein
MVGAVLYRGAMNAISPQVQFAVPEFLRTLDTIKLGEHQPEAVLVHPRMMAVTVLAFLVYGENDSLDIGDMALGALARATIDLCEKTQDRGRINNFVKARNAFAEVNRCAR